MDKVEIEKSIGILIEEGLSSRAIGKRLDISDFKVRRYAKSNNLKLKSKIHTSQNGEEIYKQNPSIPHSYTREYMSNIVKDCDSYLSVFKALNLKSTCNNNWLKKLLQRLDIDTNHFKSKEESRKLTHLHSNGRLDYSPEDISNGTRISAKKLRSYLTFHDIEEKCNICELVYWNDTPIRFDIDHIDGDNSNNKLSNLQYICPNCHRQKTIPLIIKEKPQKKYKKCPHCNSSIYYQSNQCRDCSIKIRQLEYPSKEKINELLVNSSLLQISKDFQIPYGSLYRYYNK